MNSNVENITLQPDSFLKTLWPQAYRTGPASSTVTLINNATSNITYNIDSDTFRMSFGQNSNAATGVFYNITPNPIFCWSFLMKWSIYNTSQTFRFGFGDSSQRFEIQMKIEASTSVTTPVSTNVILKYATPTYIWKVLETTTSIIQNDVNYLVILTCDDEQNLSLDIDGTNIFFLNKRNPLNPISNVRLIDAYDANILGNFGFEFLHTGILRPSAVFNGFVEIREVNISNKNYYADDVYVNGNVCAITYENLERQAPLISLSNQLNGLGGNIISNGIIGTTSRTDNCMLVLYGATNNPASTSHYGFGINSFMLRYQVPSIGNHVFYSETNEVMRITGNGRVGINITNPSERLHIAGNGCTAVIQNNNNGNTQLRFTSGTTTTGEVGMFLNSNMFIANKQAGNISFETSATQRMLIGSTGNIGINTANPTYTCHVNGSLYANTIDSPTITNLQSQINAKTSSQWTSTGQNIYFNSGNVGVGATNPIYPLQVSSAGATICMQNTNDGFSTQLRFLNSTGTTSSEIGVFQASNLFVANKQSGNLTFETTGTSRMVINSTGNVGIGTTTPLSLLDVAGTIRANSLLLGGANRSIRSIFTGNNQTTNGSTWTLDRGYYQTSYTYSTNTVFPVLSGALPLTTDYTVNITPTNANFYGLTWYVSKGTSQFTVTFFTQDSTRFIQNGSTISTVYFMSWDILAILFG